MVLPAGALVALVSFTLAAVSDSTVSPPAKEEGAAGPLRLEILVLLDETPATLLFRATNVSKGPVTVERFRHPTNHALIVLPNGGEVKAITHIDNFGKLPPKKTSEVLAPGQSKEWEDPVGHPLAAPFENPGTYKVRWKINGQTSDEILLFRRKQATFRE
jgi:hypothetical protein